MWVDAVPYPYGDVGSSTEHARAIACLRDLGVIRGTTADTFAPGGPLRRGQAASLVTRMLGVEPRQQAPFTDTAGSAHERAIAAAVDARLMRGYADGRFQPSAPITRGQSRRCSPRPPDWMSSGPPRSATPVVRSTPARLLRWPSMAS